MSTERQRQRAANHDQQLQHPRIVAAVGAKINRDEFRRGSPAKRFNAWVVVASCGTCVAATWR